MDVKSDIVTKSFRDIAFEEFLENLTKASQIKNYRVTKIVNVDHIKEEKHILKDLNVGFEFYKIVEICNLLNCTEVVSSDLRAGVFMPVRFVVYKKSGDKMIYVSFLKPSAFARLFNSKRIEKIADQMEKDMIDIIEAADF